MLAVCVLTTEYLSCKPAFPAASCRPGCVQVAGIVSTLLTPLYLWFFMYHLQWGTVGAACSCAKPSSRDQPHMLTQLWLAEPKPALGNPTPSPNSPAAEYTSGNY